MATFKSVSRLSKRNVFLLILAIVFTCSKAARILDEDASSSPVDTPVDPTSGAGSSISGGVGAGPVGGVGPGEGVTDGPAAGAAAGTIAGGAAAGGAAAGGAAGPIAGGAAAGGIAGGAAAGGTGGGAAGTIAGAAGGGGGGAAAGGAVVADADAAYGKPELTFFMHDILGGSNPSAKAVTGIVANPAVSGQVPFAKPNGAVLPQNNGGSQDNGNSALINNNNIPFLSGLSGFNPTVVQNNNNNNNNGNNLFGGSGFPVVNGGQLPQGITVQKLMFGTLTVFDDELTEGHELDSGLVGKAEGYYIASAIDGTSHTMAFTALFEEGGYVDSICFFGVHRTAVSQSVLSIMGGTGKYVNAKGVAIVKTFPATPGQTDGLETLLELSVYITS